MREELRDIQRDVASMRENLARHMGEEEAQTKATHDSIARIERMLAEYMAKQEEILSRQDSRIRFLEADVAVYKSRLEATQASLKSAEGSIAELKASDVQQNTKLALIVAGASIAISTVISLVVPLISAWIGS